MKYNKAMYHANNINSIELSFFRLAKKMIGDKIIKFACEDTPDETVFTMTPYINGQGIKRIICECGNRTETVTVLESETETKDACAKALVRLAKSSGYLDSIDPYFINSQIAHDEGADITDGATDDEK